MGGLKNRHYIHAKENNFVPPTTPQDVTNMLSHVMVEVLAGKLDPKIANAMNSVAATLLKAMEITELQERLVRLQEQQECRFPASPGPHPVADPKPS